MRDLAMWKPLVQTRDLITDPRLRNAIQEAIGETGYQTLVNHWRDVANEYAQGRGETDGLVRWVNARRTAVTGAVFAGNIGLTVQNFANLIPALDRVPSRFLVEGLKRFTVERLDLVDRVYAESATMRERAKGWNEKLGRVMADVAGRQGPLARNSDRVRQVGMWMMETTDLATAIPVYLGAKAHALETPKKGGLGLTEAEAIRHAESVVRLTQSSYRFMDRTAFERSPLFRHFTMFWGYMRSQLGMFIAAHADAKLLRHQGFQGEAIRRVVKTYALLMAGGVMADLLVGKGPEDYDGDGEITDADWAKWTSLRSVLYPASTLPVAGSFLNQMVSSGPSRDVSLTPWLRAGQSAKETVQAVISARSDEAQGDEGYQAGLKALETFGWYYGLPVAQFRRTGDYWFDITPDGIEQSQESEEASAIEAMYGTAYGKKARGRLGEALFQESR
jgi:hypothetical protein